MKSIIGGLIGFLFGYLIWFPYGIFYAVQANDSKILEVVSIIKGLLEL